MDKKPRIKVTTETIRLRYKAAKLDEEFMRKNGRRFSIKDGAKLFRVHYKKFWRWNSKKDTLVPTKKKCLHCGVSEHQLVSKWINDGTLDYLIRGVKK